MAAQAPEQGVADVQRELAAEREQLAHAVEELRSSANLRGRLSAKLPVVLAGAFVAGFVLTGGIGATMRLVLRRGRERRILARLGDLMVVERG